VTSGGMIAKMIIPVLAIGPEISIGLKEQINVVKVLIANDLMRFIQVLKSFAKRYSFNNDYNNNRIFKFENKS
jgi:hypothetical protein